MSRTDEIKTVIKQSTFLGISDKALSDNTRLESSLGLDSLDRVELQLKLELLYEIDLTNNAMTSWVTVEDVVDDVLKALPAAEG